MHTNDLIFKELLRRGYSLEGNTRVWNIADSKLWYLTPEQAQGYLDLVETHAYKKKVGPKEYTLLTESMSDLLDELGNKPLNLVDLGCGSGKKAALFLKAFQERGIPVRYCPIDISSHMVKKAIDEVSLLGYTDIIKVHWNISDFENLQNVVPLLREGKFKRNFFLLLGNTFGNFETHELLYAVRNAMRDGDVLLIGNGINNHKMEEDIVKSCRENPLRDTFFSMILKLVGFKKDALMYGVRFKNDRLETYYTVTKDMTITFQEKKIDFYKGDQIIVAFAYHYEHDDYLGYLKMYFGEVEMYLLKDGSYSLALCMK
ncbi:L-histidine N(alpha)-methyltransferase [Candidatus Pacearchaeota archaeon]|nr:L-histidine N(alpha)-methyltransferase [Candidatus Pacearchaeota archaeon]